MLSFWEKQSFTNFDFIIIGAGITGISTAIELRKKFPFKKILILERGLLPSGASTRNAGFACMGSLNEIYDDLKSQSKESIVELFELRKSGLQILRNRLGDDKIDYQENGSHELIASKELYLLDHIDAINEMLSEKYPKKIFSICTNDERKAMGFSENICKELVSIKGEGELNTGKMMSALIDLALEEKIEIKTGALVTGINEIEKRVDVIVADEYRNEIVFSAEHIFICTNAFTPKLVDEKDIQPGRGQVLVTSPIKDLPFKGIFHFDAGYYYFRKLNEGILFGGGRNLDFDGEQTDEFGENKIIFSQLIKYLKEDIIPGKDFSIFHQWSGIMAFGKNSKMPIIRKISNRQTGAYRMGGMGVAMSSAVAKQMIDDFSLQ